MLQTAKLFTNGRSQAVRLPAAFRFEGKHVFIRRDPTTGDVILSAKPDNWTGFLQALEATDVPADLLNPNDREVTMARDPFEQWQG